MRLLTVSLVFSLFLVCHNAAAQDLKLQLTTLPPLMARPGEFVTAVFTLEHQGTETETFDLELFLPEGFTLVVSLTAVSAAPETEALVFVTVLLPQAAAAGDFVLKLTATSRSFPSVSASSSAVVRVVETAKLEARVLRQAELQDRVQLSFLVRNQGNVPNMITISVISQSGFEVEFSPQMAELDVGAQLEISVTVHIVQDVETTRKQDRITLSATSTIFPDISARATAVIVLVPPLPQAVDTNLAWEMPSQGTINISESQDPNGFSASANFAGGGKFNDNRLNVRFALNNDLNVQSLALDFDTALVRVGLGDVSASFDDFTGIAGRGARLTLRSPALPSQSQLALIGIPAKGNTSVAGSFMMNLLDTQISVSTVLRFNQEQKNTIIGALFRKNFMGVLEISGQAALSNADGFWDNALKINSSFAQGPLSLDFEFMRMGPEFLGALQDQQKIELKQTLSLDELVIQSSLGFGRNNINADSSLATLGTSRVGMIARAFPGMTLPTVSVAFDYGIQKSIGDTLLVNSQQIAGTLSFTQPLDFASIALSLGLTRTVDNIAKTDAGAIVIDSSLGWSAGGFSRSLSFSNEIAVDFAAGLILGQVLTISTTLGIDTPLGPLSFRLTNVNPRTEIFAALASNVENANFTVSGALEFAKNDVTGFRINISASKRFAVPLLFIAIKGQIEGFVFVDTNGNGRRDEGEGLAQLILVGAGTRVLTDERGFFRFPPLEPGNYLVNFERLPPGLITSVTLPQAVRLKAGQRIQLAIPLQRVSIIDGLVFNDRNKNGELDAGEEGIPNVRATLTFADDTTQQTRSTLNGQFSFIGILPGTYGITLDESTFPRRFVLTTSGQLSITVQAQETVMVRFGLVEKPLEIRITFSESIAEFSFSPGEPTVGEVVRFDASASSSLGEIVKFEWDFTEDSVVDATGEKVEFIFSEPGEVLVTLTITDSDGNTAQETKTIRIKP